MIDEKIIIDTVRFINRAIEPPQIFVDIKDSIWLEV